MRALENARKRSKQRVKMNTRAACTQDDDLGSILEHSKIKANREWKFTVREDSKSEAVVTKSVVVYRSMTFTKIYG